MINLAATIVALSAVIVAYYQWRTAESNRLHAVFADKYEIYRTVFNQAMKVACGQALNEDIVWKLIDCGSRGQVFFTKKGSEAIWEINKFIGKYGLYPIDSNDLDQISLRIEEVKLIEPYIKMIESELAIAPPTIRKAMRNNFDFNRITDLFNSLK